MGFFDALAGGLKEGVGLALGGPGYLGHRLLGDDFGDALGHSMADNFLGFPFSLLDHASQASNQQYGCMPNYGGCQSPYSDYCCNSHGQNEWAAAQAGYAAGTSDGYYAGYRQAYAEMAAYNGVYSAWC